MPTLSQILLWIIRGYQLLLSPWLGPRCRFLPQLFLLCAYRDRTIRSTARFMARPASPPTLSSFNEGGYDPVPDKRMINA